IFDYETLFEFNYDKEVKLMSNAFCLSSLVLAADPNNLAYQIIGRLSFYKICCKVTSFIDQCETSPGGPLVYSLEAHQFLVYGLEIIAAGQHLLTISNKFNIFDLSSGVVVSNTHFALWTAKMYQVYTNKGELFASQPTHYQIIQIELLSGSEIEIVCRLKDIKDDQEVARDRFTIDYCFITNPDHPTNIIDNNEPCCLTGDHKNIHIYVNKPHLVNYKTERIWEFDHQLFENKDRIFAFILSNDEIYLMTVTFKGFKIFSFGSYLWKTCLLPDGVHNIISGMEQLTHTTTFSHDNRYCIACVKSTVYVFEIEWGELLTSFDSHFGHILVIKGISKGSGGNNYVITIGMDKTTKIWNVENVRKKSKQISQLDTAIEIMHISTDTQIIMPQTRTQLCLFSMKTGLIVGQLIASQHGLIYQCTVMCSNGLFGVAAESEDFVIWDVEERRTISESMITAVPNTINGSNLNNALIEQTIRAVLYAISDGDMIYEISFNIKRMNQAKKLYVYLTLPKWNGQILFDVKFRTEKVVRTLIDKRIIIHVFRTADGQQIGDTRCPAKVQRTITTQDEQTLVVGYEDEAVQMFFIID
ncbi:unnamed protein product, partial [Rotaria sp. Silwood1]